MILRERSPANCFVGEHELTGFHRDKSIGNVADFDQFRFGVFFSEELNELRIKILLMISFKLPEKVLKFAVRE